MATKYTVDPDTGEIMDPLGGLESDDLGDEPSEPAAETDLAGEVPVYKETCKKCQGSGIYRGFSSRGQTCFKCDGRGYNLYKTSPEQRAKRANPTPESRAKYHDKKERDAARKFDAWCEANPAEGTWLKAQLERTDGGSNTFATACRDGIWRFGSPTSRMVDAIGRAIVRDAEREQEYAQQRMAAELRAEPVNTVNLEAVEQAFTRAKSQGIKWPKLTLDGFQLAPAGANSKNAGAIYVTKGARDGAYLGKVLRGAFQPVRECDEQTKQAVLAAMADPLASAVAYGKKFGRCAVCMRELSDEESVARGIGPVCFDRMFGG
jgi:hypothetical protein